MSVTTFLQRTGERVRAGVPRPSRLRRKGREPRTEVLHSQNGSSAAPDFVDLTRRREQLAARVAELQWDLGGLVYEMAIRDSIRVEVIVRRAAELQNVDAELNEVERILKLEETATAGQCPKCHAPHSTGAVYCWQCGQPLLQHVRPDSIAQP
jgi:chorismate mutase